MSAAVRRRGYGTLRACVAFLSAHVEEELDADEPMRLEPRFPLTVTVAAHKPDTAPPG